MLIKTICLGAGKGEAGAVARRALRDVEGLRKIEVLRVLRHLTSDSVAQQRGQGVAPAADDIQTIVELWFDDAAACAAAMAHAGGAAFRAQLAAVAPVLFSLDSVPNIPIPPRAGAENGGFRRWMLLARKAATPAAFRDAWFGRHASLVKALPLVDGYLQHLVAARYDAEGRAVDHETLAVDGIAQMCFADEAAMDASYASPARLPLRDDGRDLLARISTLLVQAEGFAPMGGRGASKEAA